MNRFRSAPQRPPLARLILEHVLPGLAAAGLVGFLTAAFLHLGTVNRSGPDADHAQPITSLLPLDHQPGTPDPDLAIRAGLVSPSGHPGGQP